METFTFPAPVTPSAAASSIPVAYSDILKHPEQYYQGSDLVWIMFSSAAVFLMIPALSFIHAGLGNRSFSLTLFRLPMVTAAFVGLQWVLWGYTLTFSSGSLWWGGEFRTAAMRDVLARPIAVGDGVTSNAAAIPELIYILYEAMFASFTAALVSGGTMHRARPARFIIFITLWSFFVYFPIARWSWSSYGWSKQLGTLDFAGGTPVHIVSGTTVAAFAIFCSIQAKRSFGIFLRDAAHRVRGLFDNEGFRLFLIILAKIFTLGKYQEAKRTSHGSAGKIGEEAITAGGEEGPIELQDQALSPPAANTTVDMEMNTIHGPVYEPQPSNVNYVVFGTALLWFGWAGFNGGSALGGNMRAVSAWTSTHIAACSGGVTGLLLRWLIKASSRPSRTERPAGRNQIDDTRKEDIERLSVFFFCDGAIAGLVAITPAAGYVSPWSAAAIGPISAFIVLVPLKKLTAVFLRNDPLQIFAVHTGGGLVGMALTAFFVDPVIISLDGHSTLPHPEYTMGRRLGFQLLDGLMGMAYTFVVTLLILYAMKLATRIFHKSDSPYSDIEICYLEDTYQATMDQYWRSGLDNLGRPRVSTVASTIPPEGPGAAVPGLTETAPGAEPGDGPAPGTVTSGEGSTGAPTSSAFSPTINTPPSTGWSPAGSLVPTNELSQFAPPHESFLRSRDPSQSPHIPPLAMHRAGPSGV
ncbi:Rh-like protein/ammonium transporter [Rhypophila decipiens]